MKIIIDGKEYDISFSASFSEKISVLRKMGEIEVSFYLEEKGSKCWDSSISQLIFISKGDIYFWAFDDCEEISRKINYVENSYLNSINTVVNLRFKFKSVSGSTSRLMLDRQIKLQKLLL
jgi:hypothetical protein